MPVYNHYNDLKKAQELPMKENIGVCLTCSYWQADTPRPLEQTAQLAVCQHSKLTEYGLIVSGSSACNLWKMKNGSGEPAEQYAKQGE